jgi:NAD(P)-dependent dehydrogenase (short-subunit alcohol dehydrogenase family)
VVVADIDGAGATAVADAINADSPGVALAVTCDVTDPAAVGALVDATVATCGPVDLFFANAGIAGGTDLETADDDWERAFAVNVKAHYYAARRLLPAWLERGDGYFCSTASAAGLLTQIGSAPYSVTKHAALALAEWLAITYGDQGIKVSCLCPMGVNTNLLTRDTPIGAGSTGATVVSRAGPILEPDDVASAVVDAIADERFLVLPHPEVLTFFQRKAADYDRWLRGMRRLQASVITE